MKAFSERTPTNEAIERALRRLGYHDGTARPVEGGKKTAWVSKSAYMDFMAAKMIWDIRDCKDELMPMIATFPEVQEFLAQVKKIARVHEVRLPRSEDLYIMLNPRHLRNPYFVKNNPSLTELENVIHQEFLDKTSTALKLFGYQTPQTQGTGEKPELWTYEESAEAGSLEDIEKSIRAPFRLVIQVKEQPPK